MAWTTPTLQGLFSSAISAFRAHLPDADASLRRNNLRPTAKIVSGKLFEIHNFAAWAADQAFVHRADAEFLDAHGAQMKPPVPRKGATAAQGSVTVTATTAITLATGATLTRADGAAFTVDAGIVLASAGSAAVSVTASAAGVDGNCDAGVALSASSGLTGSASFAVAASGIGGGADLEQDEPYRARLLFAKAFPDHAGAPADWLRITLAIPGVTRAYIDPLAAGRGTVVVYPFFDDARANGIPLEADRAVVAGALAVARPGAGLPVVRIASAVPIDVTITGLSPATPEAQLAVAASLAWTFAQNSRVSGLSTPHPSMPFLATPQVFSRSWIWQAVANATGEERHTLTAPAADIALTEGQVATLGAVTFA